MKRLNVLTGIFFVTAILLMINIQVSAVELDADGNGLYDDVERKILVETFQQVCPSLKGTFDADGDGKVSILEQTQGRHPLSVTIGKEVLASGIQIPWAIDIFPEWIMTAYVQEDVQLGSLREHSARGIRLKNATQQNRDRQPQQSGLHRGVEFVSNSGQHLTMSGERDARWNYRWCIFTFRINAKTGLDNKTVLLDLNQGKAPNKSSPKIWYNKKTGLNIQYVGRNVGGLDKRIMTTRNIHADGKTWNVIVCGIRYGQMFVSVNGIELQTSRPQPQRFSGEMPHGTTSQIGDKSIDNMAWAYDALIFGITEPSEAMVRKMTGWAAHRLDFASDLPADHPYRYKRPVLDAEDFPYRYEHDNEKWLALRETFKDKSVTRVNAGGKRVGYTGFERVFYDDFRANRVMASTSGEGDLWMGPGFNTAVGASAPLATPGKQPNTYPYDASKKQQTLSLVQQGNRWRGSAFYSVNDMGHGYTWTGPKVFRIRCKFPDIPQDQLAGGLFPAFWSYSTNWLFWRTSNRIECDWFEFDGQNGEWLNGLSTHYHYAHVNNIFAKNPKSYQRFKAYSGELNEKKSKIPGGLYFWDGDYHTWEFVVDEKMTYANVTIKDQSGKDNWVEIYRCPTVPTYLQRLDLQLDYALKASHGTPKDGARQDFVVDWIEVLQKTREINKTDVPFTAKPTLVGTPRVGNTITCNPNLGNLKDIRYYWFADGYPLTYGVRNTWKISSELAGQEIRCMVKAVGARDMPEAWTEPVKIAGHHANH